MVLYIYNHFSRRGYCIRCLQHATAPSWTALALASETVHSFNTLGTYRYRVITFTRSVYL